MLDRFDNLLERIYSNEKNEALIYAYNILLQNQENEELRLKAHMNLLGELARQMNRGAMLPTPMVDVNNVLPNILDPEKLKEGDTFTLPEDVRLRVDEMEDAETVKTYEELVAEYGKLPSGFSSLAPIIVPIILMSLSSIASMAKMSGGFADLIAFFGTPIIALAVGTAFAAAQLAGAKKMDKFYDICNDTLKTVGPILFVTAAGGVL
jgi:hypothetical protein